MFEKVGVEERYLNTRGSGDKNPEKERMARRLFHALVLHDMIQEVGDMKLRAFEAWACT